MKGRRVGGEPGRPRLEMQGGNADLTVEPAIFQHDIGGAEQPAGAYSPARPALAAHLEQIGEIIVEQQRQVEARLPVAVILQSDALIGRAAPQENRAHDVQRILLQRQPAVAVHVGIGEVDGQRRIVVAQIGAEQQRLDFVEHHLQPGEIARIGIEQAVGPAGRGADIAVAVQHDKGVVVLERAALPRRRARHRNVERQFRDVFGSLNGDELSDFRRHLDLKRFSCVAMDASGRKRYCRRSGRMAGETAHFARDQFAVRAPSLHENIRRSVFDDPTALQHHHAVEIAQGGETMGDGNHGAPTHQP